MLRILIIAALSLPLFCSIGCLHKKAATVSMTTQTEFPKALAHSEIVNKFFTFNSTQFKEGVLLVEESGGILISCDSIKNWQSKDKLFSDESFAMMQDSEAIGTATIDGTWLNAMKPSKEEIEALGDLNFSILITAHGPPLKKSAKAALNTSIQKALKLLP